MNREAFVKATRDAEWADIDELRERCDEAGDVFSEEDRERAWKAYKNDRIRRVIKDVKDENGWPLFASVHTTDPETGKPKRVYKQEALFDPDDYRQVVEEYAKSLKRDYQMMKGYKERAEERYGLQLPLPIFVEDVVVEV